MREEVYYRGDLASIHHNGFGFHADACAPGILRRLADAGRPDPVLEIGCGSGLLTRHLVESGYRMIATDASPAMLELARRELPAAVEVQRLVLPDDPVPAVSAIVGVGHALNYLSDEDAVYRALAALAGALTPGGLLLLDLCDLEWGRQRQQPATRVWRDDDWLLITDTSTPRADLFVREMTTFVRTGEDCWRRDDERHDNVLLDTSAVPETLREYGVAASIERAFGSEQLPIGLVAVIGTKTGR